MPFFIMISVMGVILCSVLLCQYIIPLNASSVTKILLGLFFAVCSIAPAFIPFLEKILKNRFHVFYYNALLFLFVTFVILFNYTVIADIIITFGHFIKNDLIPSITDRAFINKVNIICLVLAIFSGGFAMYSGLKVPSVKTTVIKNSKITDRYKIVFLSDIHINNIVSQKKIEKLVARTNQLKPDIIILGGDIIDAPPDEITAKLNELKKLVADKIIFIPGNHEMYRGYLASIKKIKETGFTVLLNDGFKTKNNIFIGGIPDPGNFRRPSTVISSPAQAFAKAEKDNYRILISHSPKEFNETDFELEISGHTHGGQIFPFHFFAKSYNKYLAGLYNINTDKQVYVSRGSGQWGPQMRFLAPSEISELIFDKI